MSQLALEGHVVDTHEDELFRLRQQLQRLDEALRLERIKNGALESSVRDVRDILTPLYRSLRLLFGEIDGMNLGDSTANMQSESPKWEAIKRRLRPKAAEAIDILMTHGAMNTSQLAAALHMNRSNVTGRVVYELNRLGLLVKNGREFSLKQL